MSRHLALIVAVTLALLALASFAPRLPWSAVPSGRTLDVSTARAMLAERGAAASAAFEQAARSAARWARGRGEGLAPRSDRANRPGLGFDPLIVVPAALLALVLSLVAGWAAWGRACDARRGEVFRDARRGHRVVQIARRTGFARDAVRALLVPGVGGPRGRRG